MQSQFIWDVFPSSASESIHAVLPNGCITSFDGSSDPATETRPIKCLLCGAFLDVHSYQDLNSSLWRCRYCLQRNPLLESATVASNYRLSSDITAPTKSSKFVSLLVIDSWVQTDDKENFAALKTAILDHLQELSEDSVAAIITFDASVSLHLPLANDTVTFDPHILFSDSYDFLSILNDQPTLALLLSTISLAARSNLWKSDELLRSGFFLDAHDEKLARYIGQLKPSHTSSFKPPRSTGLAVLVASLLLSGASQSSISALVSVFLSGPATLNPGKIASNSEQVRTHSDLSSFKSPHSPQSRKFYACLGLVSAGYKLQDAYNAVYTASGNITSSFMMPWAPKFAFNVYSGGLNQCGLYEMEPLVSALSGQLVLADSFRSAHFRRSLHRTLRGFLGQDARVTVNVSPGLKFLRFVGNGTPLRSSYLTTEKSAPLHSDRISDTVTAFDSSFQKKHFTNRWLIGNIHKHTALCLLFESVPLPGGKYPREVYIQISVEFWDPFLKTRKLWVSSHAKPTTQLIFGTGSHQSKGVASKISIAAREKALVGSFNQRAWMVALARLLINLLHTVSDSDMCEETQTKIDSALIKVTKFFGHVKSDLVNTSNPFDRLKSLYSLNEQFSELPSLAFHLRKSNTLVNFFNSSPDETACYHALFNALSVEDSCFMIRPDLYKVDGNARLVPVPLRLSLVDSYKHRCFFVLHSITAIVIYLHCPGGEEKLPLHPSDNDDLVFGESKPPELNSIFKLVTDAFDKGWTTPKVVLTQTGHSQARFLHANLEPEGRVFDSKPRKTNKWWKFTKTSTIPSERMNYQTYYEDLLSRVKSTSITDV